MAELVGSILLKFGLGFISDKFRTYGAEKLQDGGLTDQKFRGLIVRELDDIKFKLDGLSRKDLSASISFLKQGIQRLQTCFEFGNSSTSKLPTYGKDLIDTANTGPSSSQTKPVQQSVSVEDAVVLANAIGKLKIESKERFESAKESFKKAGEEATRAFHNTALSTNERILATEVRIAGAILENLEDPHLATTDCLHYLEESHALPAIKDIFSVHVEGGIKSLFKKDSRAEIVETVTTINLMLADFITKFTKRRMAVLDWPMIECSKRVVHPIHYQEESVKKLKEMKITPPWEIVTRNEYMYQTVINSESDLIRVNPSYVNTENRLQKYDGATREWKPFCPSPPNSSYRVLRAIADNDRVYILWRNYEFDYILSVYSSDGKNTHSCPLDFIDGILMGMTVTKEKKIVFWSIEYHVSVLDVSISVYVCNSAGKLMKSFPSLVKNVIPQGIYVSLDKSADNDITVVAFSLSSKAITHFVFTQNRQLKRTIKFNSTSTWNYSYHITFDQVTKNYIVCTKERFDNRTRLECFSETGELRNALFLYGKQFSSYGRVVCHTNGAMAIAVYKKQIYLRSPVIEQ